MGQSKKDPVSAATAGENLATFAINRDDLKALLATIPENSGLNVVNVEYELQILKILSVGWAVAFYLPASDTKQQLTTRFWETIRVISGQISDLTEKTTGQAIDYFTILRQRLDTYVKALQSNTDAGTEPTEVIGPAFADACGASDNAVAILVGTKMFTQSLGSVKEYLSAIEIQEF